ncbi:MAG TPA: LptA/OstA family protein [Caulobacteraceae bacterium]|jgi:lipopolysaccharide export system protein LptA
MRPSTILKRGAALALVAASLAIGGAQAQIQGDAPVDITADLFEGFNNQGLAVWRGRVEVVQQQSRLRCSEMRAQFQRTGGAGAQPGVGASWGDIQTLTCTGPVYYVTPTQSARGDNGVYDGPSETITLTGNVVVTQGQNVASGDRAVINTRTNDSRLEAAPTRAGGGRVRTVLYPENSQPGGAPAARAPGQ